MSIRVLIATLLVVLTLAGTARAQRAGENAVRSAEDAFGATVGRDSVGLYSADDVRGFSAVVAGNLRIDGLYFDQQQAPTSHLVSSATIRVGLAAQGFAFPAPTGVVDYAVRRPDGPRAASIIVADTGWGGYSLDVDAHGALTNTLSVGIGGGIYHDVFADRTTADYRQVALIGCWRPTSGVEVTPFFEYAPVLANPATPIYITADGTPPQRLPRAYNGPQWDAYRGANENAGLVASVALGAATTLRVGAFHSEGTSTSTFAALFLGLTADGRADRVIIADPPHAYASDSAEVRLASGFAEGPRRHLLLATLRGREVNSRYGGSDVFDFGQTSIDAPGPATEPTPNFGAVTHDAVRQWSAGLSYSVSWAGLGDASVGVLHTDYRKTVSLAGSPDAAAHDAPLLWNASLAVDLNRSLVVYASHTLGLEESGQAPDVAVNRGTLTPAIRTQQTDAGLRWKPTKSLAVIAGMFEVDKPYDAVDAAGVFRQLGALSNRGIELSVTGQPLPGWTVVAGAVFLDAAISGGAVETGLIGRRPVGSTAIKAQANVEYAPPDAAWSVDLAANGRGEIIATTDRQTRLPARVTVDLGSRYRFKLAGYAFVLRLQVTNLANAGGYVVLGPGAYKRADDRKALLSLAADF